MQFKFQTYQPHKIISKIANQLHIECKTDCLEEYIDLPKNYGSGKIAGFEFSDGVSMVVIMGMFHSEWKMEFNSTEQVPIIFKFSIEGGVFHELHDGHIAYQLNAMQGSITANVAQKKEHFRLPANTDVTFITIFVDRKKYLEKVDCYIEDVPIKLQNVFKDTTNEKLFFYEGNYSFGVTECVQAIKKDVNLDIVRAIFVEGKTLELLSKLIKQYRDDLLPSRKQLLLRKYDVEKIKLAKEILISNIQNPPTIVELSKLVGINQTKLKKGFKKVYEKTIKNFLIDQRLELAQLMLLKEQQSIREVAEEVGYTNTSHFTRLFKRKYGVLPKDYAKNVHHKIKSMTTLSNN